jgi:hypothetical protein
MLPHLTVTGKHGLYALLSRFSGKPCAIVPGLAPRRGLEDMANLSQTPEPLDPDLAMCKLSLTRDEQKRPRVRKGSFGHDFDPVM